MNNVIQVQKTQPEKINTLKTVNIFGSTGSVGVNTISLIREQRDLFQVEVLSANRNVDLLASQAKELQVRKAVIADESCYQDLREILAGSGIEVAAGAAALVEAAAEPVDFTMSAIVGAAGLAPTLSAIQTGSVVALANKESLVCAGDLMLSNVISSGATLLPVDSEHNAIFQVLDLEQIEMVDRLILTASGGPFLSLTHEEMRNVTREQALAHPKWEMGAKISIDSATMMNKGLELIEAFYLFPVDKDSIDILVHPQSVIHSMVEYRDGSVLAQMASPDMRTPISYALGWPNRHEFKADRLDLGKIGSLTFFDPDPDQFPALRLAKNALEAGKSAPTILNAVNEIAVESFLTNKIGFLDIAAVVEEALNKAEFVNCLEIEDIYEEDRKGREIANKILHDKF
ncbi:MAG: 1-deoxy-D-xylulose-5-phosphate reductoisomerase [Sneathiella sp.]|nr:1-deoxy-D-xylulose-5-phosphate reductoisomerase [Sneathiella sp.]